MPQIDYQEEEIGDDQNLSGVEINSLSEEEQEADILAGADDHDNNADPNDNSSKFYNGDLVKTVNEKQDYSDDWLLSGDEENVDEYWTATDDHQTKPTDDSLMEKEQSPDRHTPDVKISAITEVGLQELLGIIDERLKAQDHKQRSSNVERDFFNRKWRPSHAEDNHAVAEQ